jgi:hypothetical protein
MTIIGKSTNGGSGFGYLGPDHAMARPRVNWADRAVLPAGHRLKSFNVQGNSSNAERTATLTVGIYDVTGLENAMGAPLIVEKTVVLPNWTTVAWLPEFVFSDDLSAHAGKTLALGCATADGSWEGRRTDAAAGDVHRRTSYGTTLADPFWTTSVETNQSVQLAMYWETEAIPAPAVPVITGVIKRRDNGVVIANATGLTADIMTSAGVFVARLTNQSTNSSGGIVLQHANLEYSTSYDITVRGTVNGDAWSASGTKSTQAA